MKDENQTKIKECMDNLLEMDAILAQDCLNYVFTQLNNMSFQGVINSNEYILLVKRANSGLNKIIYLKHYSRDIVSKKAFSAAASNLLIMLYTRPLEGNDRNLTIEELKSRQPIHITK